MTAFLGKKRRKKEDRPLATGESTVTIGKCDDCKEYESDLIIKN